MRLLLKDEWQVNLALRDGIPQLTIQNFIEDIYNLITSLTSKNYNHEIYGIAMTLCHYYYYYKSFREFDRLELSVACVYVACKMKLILIPMEAVVDMYKKKKEEQGSVCKSELPDFLKYEIEMYKILGFDLEIDTPYNWFYIYEREPKWKCFSDEKVKNVLFNIINDTYRKALCLYYHSKIIMVSAMLFTIKFLEMKDVDKEMLIKDLDINELKECMEKINEMFSEIVKK
jgi:hypothetical protein